MRNFALAFILALAGFITFLLWPVAEVQHGVRREIFAELKNQFGGEVVIGQKLDRMRTLNPRVLDDGRDLAVFTLLESDKAIGPAAAKQRVDGLVEAWRSNHPARAVTSEKYVQGYV